jgi:broad specificity phosphatase PhoE
VFGQESADDSYSRFSAAVEKIRRRHQNETVGLVSHGTVMSIFTARKNDFEGFSFWEQLKIPDLIVLGLPDYHLIS